MSKIKRKVTVDTLAGSSDDRKKPSVFERLGPGAVRRQVSNYDDSDSDRDEFVQKRCRNWVSTGSCPYGNKCKFLHGPYTATKHKGRHEEDSQEDLRLRVKPKKHKSTNKSDSDESLERSRSRAKKEKIAALILKKGGQASDSESPNQWSTDDLDFKKELELEKRRQQIQREISCLDDEDDVERENFRIEKKLPRQRVSSSDSGSSNERSRSRKAGKKKKKRNKHSRSPTKGKSFRSPSPCMDSDDHHKKHKKKKSKKHRDSMSDLDRSPELEMKSRKLLSPLKFKKSTKAVISKTIMAFHSEEDEEAPAAQPPKMHLPMPSRSPIPIIPNLPILQRAKSSSSDDGRKVEKHKDKRSITPSKKKKDRKISPEYVKEPKIEKVKSSKQRTKSRSVSMDRSLSFSPDGKKNKKLEKKKRQKREEMMERVKDSSYERSRTREGRDLTPSSDYRDFSPGREVVKKKKDKKKEKKKKDRDMSLDREDDRRHKKEKVKERERSETPPPTRKQEKRSLDRASRRDIDTRARSPSSSKGSKDTYQDRRGRSPEPAQRGDRERDHRERDGRDQRELRDPRDRDARDPRDVRIDPRDRDPRRDSRQDPRDTREMRESRDTRETREPRERDRDIRDRDVRDTRDPRERDRDPRELRDPREMREPRDPREMREQRDPRDDTRELRDPRERERPGPGREFEGRDVPVRDPREPSGRDPSGRDPRDPSARDPSARDPTGRDPRDPSARDPREISGRDQRDPSARDPSARDPSGRDPSGERRERYPDDRYREEGRRERFEDPRFPPPPPPPGGFDERGRYGRGDREGFPEPGDRGPYGRPEREQRDPGDRREPIELPFERYGGPNRGDPRYGDGPIRGRGPYDYRDQGPGWERGRGRGRGGWGRGGHDRGGRYDDRSRRGEWDSRRQDEFYGPDRREWQDRRDDNRRDDRRDGPKEEGRDKRDEKTDSEKEKDVPAWDNEGKREDKKENKEVKKEEKKEETDKKEEKSVKEDVKRHEQDLSDVEKKDKKKDEERSRERKDDDRKDRGKDKDKSDTRIKDSSGDRKKEEDRKKDEESTDRSRKRRASNEGSRSPSVKKVRDASPALSTHSKKSNRDATKEREPETDIPSDKGSVAGSERSKKADSERSRQHKSHKDEEKRSKKGSDTESLDRKRSRSRSRDGSDSGDSKRRRTDAYQEGVGQLAGYVIKDTVGSDREDTIIENIEQNFSDWSDNDSDDDILNRPGETASAQDRGQSPHGSIGSKHSEKTKIKEEGGDADKEGKKSAEGKGPGELESISSDEGSLVEHVKKAVVDALEIDWASMVKDERPKLSTSSALKRFKPGALFAKMGISRQYAGEDLYKEVLEVCQRHQDIEAASLEVDSERAKEQCIKTEKSDNEQQDKQTTNNAQTEPNQTESTAKNNTVPKFEFLHDVAMFHSSAVQKLKERRNLLSNIGPFRRALCARRDLEIRRQLCRVDKVLDQSQMYTSQDMDSDLYKLSIQMLKQAKDPSLKVEAPPPVAVPEKCSPVRDPVRDSTTLEQTIVEVTCG